MNKKKKKKLVYIAGPITGYDLRERSEAFVEVSSNLLVKGYATVNPMETFSSVVFPENYTKEQIMKVDLAMLNACDAIYLMKGWQTSQGCVAEYTAAVATGKEILYQEDV